MKAELFLCDIMYMINDLITQIKPQEMARGHWQASDGNAPCPKDTILEYTLH